MDLNILKNSSWVFGAQSLVKVISFVFTIYLAGKLGVEGFGLYSAALAYFSLFASVSDIGLSRYLIREGARDTEKLNNLLTVTLILRLILIISVLLIVTSFLLIFDNDPIRRYLSILAMLAIIPQAVALTFDAVLVAKQSIKLSSIGVFILSLLTTSIGYFMTESGYGAKGVLFSLIMAEVLYAGLMGYFVVSSGIHFTQIKKLGNLKEIILGSLPYGILGIMGLVYFKIDTLFLSYLRGSYETGLYTVSYRFLEALVFIPSALTTAAFPVLSRLHGVDNRQIKKIYYFSVLILGGLSVVFTLGYLFVLPVFLQTLLPEYVESVNIIRILSLTIPFMFIHVPGAAVLLTSDKLLKPVIYLSFITLGFNVISNLIFIPIYGIYAAAWITVASEALSFIVFFLLLYKKILRHG